MRYQHDTMKRQHSHLATKIIGGLVIATLAVPIGLYVAIRFVEWYIHAGY